VSIFLRTAPRILARKNPPAPGQKSTARAGPDGETRITLVGLSHVAGLFG